jgi:hypothetical protein
MGHRRGRPVVGRTQPRANYDAARREPGPSRLASTPANLSCFTRPQRVAGVNDSSVCGDRHPHLPVRTPCPHWDSNPDWTDFKSAASADWAMGAQRLNLARRRRTRFDAWATGRCKQCVKSTATHVKRPLTRYLSGPRLRKGESRGSITGTTVVNAVADPS